LELIENFWLLSKSRLYTRLFSDPKLPFPIFSFIKLFDSIVLDIACFVNELNSSFALVTGALVANTLVPMVLSDFTH